MRAILPSSVIPWLNLAWLDTLPLFEIASLLGGTMEIPRLGTVSKDACNASKEYDPCFVEL